jgi:hypothetical protein
LNLGHTSEQIYDKHKTIGVNANEATVKDDFIQQQNIAYLD